MKKYLKYAKFSAPFLILCLSLIPIIWFIGRGGYLVNGVDTNFPLNPSVWFLRRFFTWNAVSNAGADFSASTSGLFFHLVQVIPFLLGLKLQLVELVSFLFWFLTILFSSFFLARVLFPKKFVAQIVFVVFYSFNVYLFNTWENVKVSNLSLVSAIPLGLAILILLDKKKIRSEIAILLSLITGIILSGAGINPSYIVCFFLICSIYLFGNLVCDKEKISKLKNFFLIVIPIVLINSFWIIPSVNYIFNNIPSQGSLGTIGFTNWVSSLSENTSLFNVMRLQGAWDWYAFDSKTGLPQYLPYVLNYFYSLPFILFSLFLPIIAAVSLVVRNKTKINLYVSFTVMCIVGIFLGAGMHQPTGGLFTFLSVHIPFFSLFRSPWYIFTPLVILSYAGLAGLLFEHIADFDLFKKNRTVRLGLILSVSILIVGQLIYNYPLITGRIFRPTSSPSFYVQFPSYVFEAGNWLSKTSDGRVIGYPPDELERFDWNYVGIESILQLLTDREVLFTPVNSQNFPISVLIKNFYENLQKGQLVSARSIAEKLNISTIFIKNDQPSLAMDISKNVKALESHIFGKWEFRDFPEDGPTPKIYSSRSVLYAYPYNGAGNLMSAVEKTDVVNPTDDIIESIPSISDFSGDIVSSKNIQDENYNSYIAPDTPVAERLIPRDLSTVTYQFEIPEDGLYQPKLEKYHVEDFGLKTIGDMPVEVNDKKEIWTIEKANDSYLFFKEREFTRGKYTLNLKLQNKNLIVGGDFETKEQFSGLSKGSVEIKEDSNGKFLSVSNADNKEHSAIFTVPDYDPFRPYYVELRYKQVYGKNAQVTVKQDNKSAELKLYSEDLPTYPEWRKYAFYYQPVVTQSSMKIALVAPISRDPLGEEIYFDDLSVKKVFNNTFVLLKKVPTVASNPIVNFKKISPVKYEGEVDSASGPHFIVFSENYSPDWEMRIEDSNGKPISFPNKHFSINQYANAWFFDSTPEKYKFTIYYKPQNLVYLGRFVSISTMISVVLLIIYRRRKKWSK